MGNKALDSNFDPDESKLFDDASYAAWRAELTRRETLLLAGTTGLLAAIIGCGGGGSSTSSTSGTTTTTGGTTARTTTGSTTSTTGSTTTTTGTTGSSGCGSVTPEGEIGPYFADDSSTGFNRSNIVANVDGSSVQSGIPLTLKIYVYDTENSCSAMEGCQVDIWHCNASGVYSDISAESTSGQTYLRGYQLTDSTGQVTFTTIIPGWYSGRTTHIHLRIRSKYSEAFSTSDGTNTTQVFFSQTLLSYISSNVAPYKSEGVNPTTNAGDRVYADQTLGENLMSLTGSYAAGFTTSVAIYLPITSE